MCRNSCGTTSSIGKIIKPVRLCVKMFVNLKFPARAKRKSIIQIRIAKRNVHAIITGKVCFLMYLKTNGIISS
jgi:hypothetical protein